MVLPQQEPNYNIVATQVSTILANPATSVDDKMTAISRAFAAGAGIFDTLFGQNRYLNGICAALADENDMLQRAQAELKQQNTALGDRVSALAAWKEKRNLERKTELAEAAATKNSIVLARSLLGTNAFTLGTVPIALLNLPSALMIGPAVVSLYSFYNMNRSLNESWVYNTFPEAAKSAQVREAAMKLAEAKSCETSLHSWTVSNIESSVTYSRPIGDGDHDEEYQIWTDAAKLNLQDENARHEAAVKAIDAEIDALRASVNKDFYE